MREINGEILILFLNKKISWKLILMKNLEVREEELTAPYKRKGVFGDGWVFNLL